MKYPYKKDWWETKDHKKIKISDMEASHIENTINFLKKNTIIFMLKNIDFMIMMRAKFFVVMKIIHI